MIKSAQMRSTFAALGLGFLVASSGLVSGQETEGKSFPQLEFRKWSGPINVPDPVAVSVDAQGRVFATQTRRRKAQDLDIREHRQWIPDDLGLSSVEQKRAFFKTVLAIGGDQEQQREHIADFNGDGEHDWRDLTVISEVIYRLVDTDQDGTADEMTVFAEDFKTEVTGIAAGVLAHDGYVYATIAPDLWKLRDKDDDGIADERESLVHGFGVHIAVGGHDMHGLTVGPDGKIYWSIGDKGIHVQREGKSYFYPNQGGVMRCNPDGSDFEVFAHGLRNTQEVAFDQFGNLFGVDNDSDNEGESERFVYIVEGMDAGWRSNYQYRGSEYNPWMEESLWDMPGEEHPAYIVPPLGHYVDGPAGFKFNPGTALVPEYKDFFFLTSAPNGQQYAFRREYSGDSFKMVDQHRIGSGLAIVGLAFGPDGALYGADWDGGYPLDEIGSIVRIDVPASSKSEQRKEVQELLTRSFADLGPTQLAELLGHEDQRVRLKAQFELVKLDAGNALAGVAVSRSRSQLARIHAVWGLGQLGRQSDTLGRDIVGLLMADKDAQLRAQAVKTYGELPDVEGTAFLKLLNDDDLHVRTLAGIALRRHPTSKGVEPLLKQAEELDPDKHYVRHSLVSALAACATAEQLTAEADDNSEMVRLCCVLALRRQASADVAQFLDDKSLWVATEAARAIHDDNSIPEALSNLAAVLDQRGEQNEAFTRRAINAGFRLGGAENALRLLSFAQQTDRPLDMRLEALETLRLWEEPPVIDRVEGRRRDLDPEQRSLDKQHLAIGLADLASGGQAEIRASAVSTARALHIELPLATLLDLAKNTENDEATRIASLDALAVRLPNSTGDKETEELSADELKALLMQGSRSTSAVMQIRALELLSESFSEAAQARIGEVLEADANLTVKQRAIELLPELPDGRGEELLRELGSRLQSKELPAELALEVTAALRKSEIAADYELPENKYEFARDGGDPQRGEELFRTHVQAQCIRCHRVGKRGSEIGPPLGEIAKTRDADYLLRSIVQPSADIDEKYRTQMLLLDTGEVIKGVVQREDDSNVIVADEAGNLLTFEKDAIEESREQKISLMPEMNEILSAREVRDLVAYLRTLK